MIDTHSSNLHHAGILERGVAWFIDGIVLLVCLVAVLVPALALFGSPSISTEAANGIGILVGFTLSMAYYAGTEAAWERTPGKMALGLRVVSTDGRQCTVSGAVLRNVTKVLGGSALLAVLVAIVCIYTSDQNQRLGDTLARTTVVKG